MRTASRIRGHLVAAVLLGPAAAIATARQEPRVVRANSAVVDVEDGNDVMPGYWTAVPGVAVDTYYAQRSSGSKRVRFKTDQDSIEFDVAPGDQYDFTILLHGTEACPTRISTLRRPYRRERDGSGATAATDDTIPFTLGSDGKIHLHGAVNGSAPLDFMFDTGADRLVLFPTAFAKQVRVSFDGTVANAGVGGTTDRRTSDDNRLQIGDLIWDHEGAMYIEKQADDADGIVGFDVFEDKIVEIDFDRRTLVVHAALPASASGWARLPVRSGGTIPFIEATLFDGETSATDWMVFDTGADASVQLGRSFTANHRLSSRLQKLGTSRSGGVGGGTVRNEVVSLPTLTIGTFALHDVPVHCEVSTPSQASAPGLLGMDVLRRFNVLLDYPGNAIYLAPNGLFGAPFRKRFGPDVALWIAGGLAAAAVAAIVLVRRRPSRALPVT